MVLNHAGHVLLHDGLEKSEGMWVGGWEWFFEQWVTVEIKRVGDVVSVVLDESVAADELVDSTRVIDGPCTVGMCCEEVLSEGDKRIWVMEYTHECGEYVGLLCDSGHNAYGQITGGVVEEDWDTEESNGGLIERMVGLVGVVAGDDEKCVFEPGLPAGGGEELAKCVVGVSNAFVYWQFLFGVEFFVAIGDIEGVVRGGCEESSDKRFMHVAEHGGVVLEEWLIPNSPSAIKVCIASKA